MEKLVVFLFVTSYLLFQGFIAGCLFEDTQSASDFIKEVKAKASLFECVVFGPAILTAIIVKLFKVGH